MASESFLPRRRRILRVLSQRGWIAYFSRLAAREVRACLACSSPAHRSDLSCPFADGQLRRSADRAGREGGALPSVQGRREAELRRQTACRQSEPRLRVLETAARSPLGGSGPARSRVGGRCEGSLRVHVPLHRGGASRARGAHEAHQEAVVQPGRRDRPHRFRRHDREALARR